MLRVSAGGAFDIALSKSESTMSVLVTGDAEHLRRRWTLHGQTFRLLDWFFYTESLAWKWIEDHYGGRRRLPDSIFIVQG